jgi:transcription elongation factor GreA
MLNKPIERDLTLEEFNGGFYAKLSARLESVRGERERAEQRLEDERESARRASEHGDRSENAELQTAMENAGAIAENISALLMKEEVLTLTLKSAGVKTGGGPILVGSAVLIKETSSGKRFMLKIVPKGAGDYEAGAASEASPIGKALRGKRAGDIAEVRAPLDAYIYEILEVI